MHSDTSNSFSSAEGVQEGGGGLHTPSSEALSATAPPAAFHLGLFRSLNRSASAASIAEGGSAPRMSSFLFT